MALFGKRGHTGELGIPPIAGKDPMAVEIGRMWSAQDSLHVSLHLNPKQDPAVWGIILSDLLQHVVNAYEQMEGLDREATRERICAVLRAELESPTGEARGNISDQV